MPTARTTPTAGNAGPFVHPGGQGVVGGGVGVSVGEGDGVGGRVGVGDAVGEGDGVPGGGVGPFTVTEPSVCVGA